MKGERKWRSVSITESRRSAWRQRKSVSQMLMVVNLKGKLTHLPSDTSGLTINTHTHTAKYHSRQHGAITNEDLTSVWTHLLSSPISSTHRFSVNTVKFLQTAASICILSDRIIFISTTAKYGRKCFNGNRNWIRKRTARESWENNIQCIAMLQVKFSLQIQYTLIWFSQ